MIISTKTSHLVIERILWAIVGMLLMVAVASSQSFRWQSYTNTDDIRDIAFYDGNIWCATSGGLMSYNTQNQDFQVWTNSEGLTHNNIQQIGVDFWGRIWAGMSNGQINIFDPEDGSLIVREDLADEIFEFTVIDTAWSKILVAHDQGLTIYRQGEGAGDVQVAETVQQFGVEFQSNIRVSDIAIVDEWIWVSTFYGLARASGNQSFLSPPTVWTNYTLYHGLPSNNVVALASWQGSVVAGTENGVAQFNGQQFVQMGDPIDVLGLSAFGNSLWAWTVSSLYLWSGTSWQQVGGDHPNIAALTQDDQTQLWAGHENKVNIQGSLAYFSNGQWSDRIVRNGISWNKINALFLDSQRRLWVTGISELTNGLLAGLNLFEDSQWHNWTRQDPLYNVRYFQNPGRTIVEDPYGSIWGGSFGGGVIQVTGITNDTLQFYPYVYTEVDTPWVIGIPPRPPGSPIPYYVVIQDIALDNSGNLWMVNRDADNGNMIIRVPNSYLQNPDPTPANSPWDYFSVLAENLDPHQENLMIDDFNRVWIAGGDPNDSPGKIYVLEGSVDDYTWVEISFDEALYVNDMTIDQSGTLWLATRDGIYYAMLPSDPEDLNILPMYGAVGGDVRTVHVDAQNNKWFGTDHGVSVLNAAYSWTHHFPAEDGPVPYGLIGGNVQHITSNPATGDVWIATITGLSLVKTPYRQGGGPLSTIKVFPNPFHPGGGDRLQFHTVDFHRALIYTINGKLIRELSAVEAMIGWDGTDDEGDIVGSGIYLILVTSAEGNTKLGKVAVVR